MDRIAASGPRVLTVSGSLLLQAAGGRRPEAGPLSRRPPISHLVGHNRAPGMTSFYIVVHFSHCLALHFCNKLYHSISLYIERFV